MLAGAPSLPQGDRMPPFPSFVTSSQGALRSRALRKGGRGEAYPSQDWTHTLAVCGPADEGLAPGPLLCSGLSDGKLSLPEPEGGRDWHPQEHFSSAFGAGERGATPGHSNRKTQVTPICNPTFNSAGEWVRGSPLCAFALATPLLLPQPLPGL